VLLLEGRNTISNEAKKGLSLPHPCPFLDKNNTCTIYGSRPKTCIIYPFFTRKAGGKVEYSYDENCPGVNKGRKIDLQEVHKIVKKMNSDIRALKENSVDVNSL
jgi:Fe-S-cluster containining protein